MKNNLLLIVTLLIVFFVSCNKKPYKLCDNYIYIQNEDRRNDSTE